jgi:hypothetical protein
VQVIDVRIERTYTLNTARRWFPRRRRGKRPTLQTMYRWSNQGYHGVVLETVQIGSTRCTSKEACARFIERVSALSLQAETAYIPARNENARQIENALKVTGFDRRSSASRADSRALEDGNAGG